MAIRLGFVPSIPIVFRPPTPRVLSYRSPVCAQGTQQVVRRSANYKPTIWHDKFIQSLSGNVQDELSLQRVCKLKNEVKHMIDKEEALEDKLELIDTLQQLGVSYHFNEEITDVMNGIFGSMDQILARKIDDIHVTSLLFRLLRMHGHNVSEDVFNIYMDEKGDFKASLCENTKGMLSLYEASHLAKTGEETLEKARDFTTRNLANFLNSSANDNNTRLRDSVAHALELPLHWRIERLHTRWFIDSYSNTEKMRVRPTLLEFAKLDFNLVQDMYKQELKSLSRWWTYLGLYEKLPFARDRLVENYLWSVGFTHEPKLSSRRRAQTKANCFITVIDDIYDVYGSMDELIKFTDAVERWDIAAIKDLPEYMKICFIALFNTVNELGYEVMREKGLDIIPHLRRSWAEICKAYLVEAKWYHNGYVPTLEEYLETAWVSISGHIILTNAYCFNPDLTAKDLEYLSHGYPDTIRFASVLLRLYDDLGTSTAEIERGDTAKSIQCYMNDHGVTESIAREKIKESIHEYWKKLNGEETGNSAFNEYLKSASLNAPRMAQCIYQFGDGFGEAPDRETKDRVMSLLVEPIEI